MSVSKNLLIFIIVIASFLFLLDFIVLLIFPSLYQVKLEEQTNIVKKSLLYNLWQELPMPVYHKLYFFNITNAEYYMKYGGRLDVEEVGPYTYEGTWVKEDIDWHPNGTVSYREVKTFDFVPEMSVGSKNDHIYSLNGPLIMAADYLKEKPDFVRQTANKFFKLSGEKLIIRKSIGELAFDGYKDAIISLSKYLRPETPFKGHKFCWFYGRNATDEGLFTVFTGEKDHKLLNKIEKWNGESFLTYWKNDTCNMINGTNAEFGPPFLENQVEYTFFQPLFCRSVTFEISGMTSHKDIDCKRFVNTAKTFSKDNPDNYCFDIDENLESGFLNVSPCQFKAPIVLSFPHFYLADTSYFDYVNGLTPNKTLHSSHIDIEPSTGVTIDLSIKVQVNIKMEPVEYLSNFEHVEPSVYPVFWLDISVALKEDTANFLKDQLFKPRTIAFVTIGFVGFIALIVNVVAIWKLLKIKSESTEDEREPLVRRKNFATNNTITFKDSPTNLFMNNSSEKLGSHDIVANTLSEAKALVYASLESEAARKTSLNTHVEVKTVKGAKISKQEDSSKV